VFFPAKVQRSGANDGDASGCRDLREGIVAATLSALGLWVKTQDLVVSMTPALLCVITSLGALSWSLGSLVLVDVFGGKLDVSLFFLFIFDLFVTCKKFPSSLCIGLTIGFYL
jgi:hypothetical protein